MSAARERRREAAVLRTAEMKAGAVQALADFHHARKISNAAALRHNLDEEAHMAAVVASEINPWNAVSSDRFPVISVASAHCSLCRWQP
eukprot:SAG31_NODE_691_length_12779_cov_19.035095_15_plen_89_part_00